MKELLFVLVANRRDPQGRGSNEGNQDDPAPDLGAVQVDGGVEPPVAEGERDDAYHREHDKRSLTPCGDLLHDSGALGPAVLARRAAEPTKPTKSPLAT